MKLTRLNSIFISVILIFLASVLVMPLLVTFINSFMSSYEILNRYSLHLTADNFFDATGTIHFVEISLIPTFVTLNQYFKLLFDTPLYLGLFWNSVQMTLPIVLGQILLAIPTAYVFEFSRIRCKEIIFYIYVVIMLMPLQVSLVPNFLTAEFLNLSGYWAIVLPAIFSPFGVFLIRQSLKGMPIEYIEAAKVDGASHIKILFHIIMPLTKPALAALAMLSFVDYWNIVDQAVVFIKESHNEPLSVYLSRLSVGDGVGIIFAASCFYMLPSVLIFLYGQENMIEGIRLSGIK